MGKYRNSRLYRDRFLAHPAKNAFEMKHGRRAMSCQRSVVSGCCVLIGRLHCLDITWLLCFLVFCLHGCLAFWFGVFTAAWHLGFLVSWFLGCLVSWFLGFLSSWLLGILVSWFLGFLSSWLRGFLGFLVSRLRGCLCVGQSRLGRLGDSIGGNFCNSHTLLQTCVRI